MRLPLVTVLFWVALPYARAGAEAAAAQVSAPSPASAAPVEAEEPDPVPEWLPPEWRVRVGLGGIYPTAGVTGPLLHISETVDFEPRNLVPLTFGLGLQQNFGDLWLGRLGARLGLRGALGEWGDWRFEGLIAAQLGVHIGQINPTQTLFDFDFQGEVHLRGLLGDHFEIGIAPLFTFVQGIAYPGATFTVGYAIGAEYR